MIADIDQQSTHTPNFDLSGSQSLVFPTSNSLNLLLGHLVLTKQIPNRSLSIWEKLRFYWQFLVENQAIYAPGPALAAGGSPPSFDFDEGAVLYFRRGAGGVNVDFEDEMRGISRSSRLISARDSALSLRFLCPQTRNRALVIGEQRAYIVVLGAEIVSLDNPENQAFPVAAGDASVGKGNSFILFFSPVTRRATLLEFALNRVSPVDLPFVPAAVEASPTRPEVFLAVDRKAERLAVVNAKTRAVSEIRPRLPPPKAGEKTMPPCVALAGHDQKVVVLSCGSAYVFVDDSLDKRMFAPTSPAKYVPSGCVSLRFPGGPQPTILAHTLTVPSPYDCFVAAALVGSQVFVTTHSFKTNSSSSTSYLLPGLAPHGPLRHFKIVRRSEDPESRNMVAFLWPEPEMGQPAKFHAHPLVPSKF